MKYLVALLAGLVGGGAIGAAALYVNPLTQAGTDTLEVESAVLEFALPGIDALVVTHGGSSTLPRKPRGVPELWESGIADLGLTVLTLDDGEGSGSRAVASRIRVPSPATDLLLGGAIVTDYWLVTVPGQGSFFAHVDNNLWPFIKDVLLPVRYLGQAMQGPVDYAPTVGPAANRSAAVYGGTGRFASTQGTARASLRIDRFDKTRGLEAGLERLHLDFALPVADESLGQASVQ